SGLCALAGSRIFRSGGASRMLGFAIVGCGMIARFHARALQDVPDTRLVALVSRKPANANAVADSVQATCDYYPDWQSALARGDVDVRVAPPPGGAPLGRAVAAAAAGKHVVVEKPLEIPAERCDRIIEACDRHGVQLCTIFPSRFADSNRALKSAVDAGRFGRL